MAEQARTQLERRYLDGVPTLFPGLAGDWQRLREEAQRLASLGDDAEGHPVRPGRLASPGSGAVRSSRRTSQRDRAQAETGHLVDIARSSALDLLGDTDGAAGIAEHRLETL